MKRIFIEETVKYVGEVVKLAGWVHNRRDHGKIIFIDLRDKTGIIQTVVIPDHVDVYEEAKKIRNEFVIEIEGLVKERPQSARNEKSVTGGVEMEIEKLSILNECKALPFEINKDTRDVSEELRLKHRYLDLRTERMKNNVFQRGKITKFFRDHLEKEGFLEVETPVLGKSTAEGARDYIVPSRIYKGKFYALPQSPQQYKQLLMTAGIERYFQVAKCFRDEDTRGDRQPEFTQLDLEMSFVEQEDVMNTIETMLIKTVTELYPEKKIQAIPFPRITYKDAMEKYGSDRPDSRTDKNDPNLLAFCWVVDFPFFEKDENSTTGWTFTHNPFSSPKPEHMQMLMDKKDVAEILTTQYDVVLNGYEVGGGSIRNHRPEALKKVLDIMGIPEERVQREYGHMLEAFEMGTPPHGGIALGFDRLVMLLQNEPNIREVIPFAKNGEAEDMLMGAPSAVEERQLSEVGIRVPKLAVKTKKPAKKKII
ncbi:MAG: aspartyl-tRNA synthetase, aspartyl-tRNA synthetase [Parcubacteria group bacterium GW2011_GWC1_45_14]|nr:MAG: Aspartyl-tRNA synthetase [Candidatus Moranbacteria bacterium GW2011_GWC2_45_10]KKT95516.1 MAG: aspartyl-tRNA synthetase, aspartyl-tRNA synthetase [Parcubacteria group bacterium GW2011_GWC1_45_14]